MRVNIYNMIQNVINILLVMMPATLLSLPTVTNYKIMYVIFAVLE